MRTGTEDRRGVGQAPRPPARLAGRLLVALGFCIANIGTAWAHTQLVASIPGDGQVVTPAPTALRLTFNEALEPAFSRVEITGADGQAVTAGKLRVAADDKHSAIVPVPAMPPGRYQISWSAMGRDGHRMKGEFSFSVK